MTVLPAADAYARHFRACTERPCALCDHLAARMAAEADGEEDDTDTASRPAHGADAGAQ